MGPTGNGKEGGEGRDGKGREGVPECPNPELASLSFVKMASVVPDGFEVAVDSKLSSRLVMHDRKHMN